MHATGHLRADHQTAMAALHQAVADANAARFREVIVLAVRSALAGLDRDAVVTDRKTDTCNRYVAAALRV